MEQIINRIHELLIRLNGVEIISIFSANDIFRIEMIVIDSGSRFLLHKISESTNVALNVYVDHQISEEESKKNPDKALVYRFNSYGLPDAENRANWLGAHLTWAIYKEGQISAEEEQKLCRFFGAISRSA